MPLKTTHVAGDAVKAEDMNDTVKGVLQNAHNIFELFLENFFAAKITPFNGLFFDGFSDTTKADITATTLTAGASSGQAILPVASTAGFIVGHNINIFDGTNLDEKVIQSIDSPTQITLTTNLDNTYVSTDDVQRSTVNFDTANKKIDFDGIDVGDDKKVVYFSKLQSFQTAIATARLWIVRNILVGNVASIDLELSSSQFLSITDASQTGLDITGDITIEAWVNPETQTVMQIVSKRNDQGSQKSYDFIYTGTLLVLGISDNGSSREEISKAQVLPNGTWAHVAVVWTASTSTAEFFVNGSSIGTSAGAKTAIFNSTSDFMIGAFTDGAGTVTSFWDGLIDQVRVWDDKRTSTEILENKDKQLTGAEANLQGCWGFPNDLLDKTSNDNDLTNNGSAVFSTSVPFTGTQFNLDSSISAGATTLTILGDQTGSYANGDIVDISTPDNLVRERKTLTATPSFGSGVTTLTFSATANAFTTADFVERVDVIPQISLVDKDAEESFNAMTHIKSIVDFENSEVEDEYSFEAGTPNEDIVVKLDLTRENVTLLPEAKRLGVTLNE